MELALSIFLSIGLLIIILEIRYSTLTGKKTGVTGELSNTYQSDSG